MEVALLARTQHQQPCPPLLHTPSRNCSPILSCSFSPQLPPRTSSPTPLSNPCLHSATATNLYACPPHPLSLGILQGAYHLRRSLDGSGGTRLWRSKSGGQRMQPQRNPRLVFVRFGGDFQDGSSGEEPPETLFMRELKRRGMSPSTRSEDKDSASSTETATLEGTNEGGADASDTQLRSGGFTIKSAPLWTDERDTRNQRERSMALNSEGLDGLIPRAQELLKLGGSFFLAFWPLIFASLAAFIALYIYFGATFIHAGNSSQVYRPPYVDPYKLLEEEVLPPELGPSSVPFLQ
ncbi:hypothetical protein O6H91_04G053300 [Diphasiastrum complanatum]|uniref:Uncharacterized protein n=2 Tax=Diphasiastrum complanatum TaxID=34168 RepID=A0ACC2DWH2_DIPCM|nr:hypothetical protein O6H91_04G044000 [Diphasiastrum complanatum]KAJ7558737.1 hypothetical protein O6H91_04G053300 [Diphasiastrum complanatum]